jgi:hypothetical protein
MGASIPDLEWGRQHRVQKDEPDAETQRFVCYHCLMTQDNPKPTAHVVMIAGTVYCVPHARMLPT